MARVYRLETLPENAQDFIEEIAQGMAHIYGAAAAQEYLARAKRSFAMSLVHPLVEAYAINAGGTPAAMIIGIQRDGVGEISLLHVRSQFEGQGLEARLARKLVQSFRRSGVLTILFESVTTCQLDVSNEFARLGFEAVERELMLAPISGPLLALRTGHASQEARADQWQDVAECIVDAYSGHMERKLHREVNDPASALDFVARVAAGNYGHSDTRYVRGVWREGRCVGAILGCCVAPDTGFVLQLVVRHEARRRGIGRLLLQDLAQAYGRDGLRQVGLGVTSSNPAKLLYQALGFRKVLPVKAYVWWRRGQAPG